MEDVARASLYRVTVFVVGEGRTLVSSCLPVNGSSQVPHSIPTNTFAETWSVARNNWAGLRRDDGGWSAARKLRTILHPRSGRRFRNRPRGDLGRLRNLTRLVERALLLVQRRKQVLRSFNRSRISAVDRRSRLLDHLGRRQPIIDRGMNRREQPCDRVPAERLDQYTDRTCRVC